MANVREDAEGEHDVEEQAPGPDEDPAGAEDQVPPLEDDLENDRTRDSTSDQYTSSPVDNPSLGAPVELAPALDPAKRMSTVVRQVRNQANAATMSLRKSPVAPASQARLLKKKSIRNLAISNPTFVSGPDHIPSVPIAPSTLSAGLNKSKPSGFGLRFKMLLGKSGKEKNAPLPNGDEVAPFVDFDAPLDPAAAPPFTPPSPAMEQFAAREYPQTPEFPQPPEGFSPPGRSRASPGLAPVAELPVRASLPDAGAHLAPASRRADNRRSHSSHTEGSRGSLSQSASGVDSPASTQRQPSLDSVRTGPGGLAAEPPSSPDSSRAAVSYDVGSSRRRRADLDYSNMPSTAPLAVLRPKNPPALSIDPSPASLSRGADSAPLPAMTSGFSSPSQSVRRSNPPGTTDSMKKLWEAASDLGLPLNTVRELVDLSSTSSDQARLGSMSTPPLAEVPRALAGGGLRRAFSTSTSHRPTFNQSITPPTTTITQIREEPAPLPPFNNAAEMTLSPSYSSLHPPRAPSPHDSFSRPSSGYAGSVFDLYGDEDDAGSRTSMAMGEQQILPGPRIHPENEAEALDEAEAAYMRQRELQSELEEEDDDDNVEVWKVVGDLRNNRESIYVDQRRFSGISQASDGDVPAATDPFSLLVSRHRKDQASHQGTSATASTPAPPARGGGAARYPSIYVRDEQRLEGLENGVSSLEFGQFIVRPRMSTAAEQAMAQDRGAVDGWKREAGANMI